MSKKIHVTFVSFCLLFLFSLLFTQTTYAKAKSNKAQYDPEFYEQNEVTTYATASSTKISDYNHGKKKGSNIALCVDVSKWNDTVDFKKAKKAGVKYVFIRIGYSTLNGGTPTLDPRYKENIKNAKAAGIKVGVYYYSQATTESEALKEVDFILKNLNGEKLDLPVVYDAECGTYTKNGKTYKGKLALSATSKSATKWTKVAKAFCNAIEKADYTPMVYGAISKLNKEMGGVELSKSYAIWIARYNYTGKVLNDSKYSFKGNYQVWQCSENGNVSGIGKCDLNFLYEDDMHVWDNKVTKKASINNDGTYQDGIRTYFCKYHGEVKKEVPIYAIEDISLSKVSYTYNGNEKKPSVSIVNRNGEVLDKKNYTVTYDDDCVSVGSHQVTVTFKNEYEGTSILTYTIKKASQALEASDFTKAYTTKAFPCGVEQVIGDGTLTFVSSDPLVATIDEDGQIFAKGIGTTTITVTASATKNYKKKVISFDVTIKLATPKISKIESVSDTSMKLTWNKNSLATGYAIRYSTSKSMTNAKSVTVKGNKTVTKIIKNLKQDKTYYVQVQSTSEDTSLNSNWSSVKSYPNEE